MDTINFRYYNKKKDVSRTTLENAAEKYFDHLGYTSFTSPDETDALVFSDYNDFADYITYDDDNKRNPRGSFMKVFFQLLKINKDITLKEAVDDYAIRLQHVFIYKSDDANVVFFLKDY